MYFAIRYFCYNTLNNYKRMTLKVDTVNILQIGLGFHAKRIYLPTLKRFSEQNIPVKLVAGVDIVSAKDSIEQYLKGQQLELDVYYIEPFSKRKLPKGIEEQLNSLVVEKEVNAVVISTDPIVHKAFAAWAIKKGLHILMDKPVTAREKVNSSTKQAKGLIDDYNDLRELYNEQQKISSTVFSIMVQRRYEEGYRKVFELIKEVGNKFNAPVTSIQASHSDGVWIFPDEIVDQTSHPYSTGYGKNSHSGYHIFDIIWQFYLASGTTAKRADKGDVMTSFLSPAGLLRQFGQEDFALYFPDYYSVKRRSELELNDLFEKYGEIDAFSIIRLIKGKETICNISTNLIHNGFSRRSWSLPKQDLYKGNGRVKHQSYSIQQGPFQNIQIHQYQSEDNHDRGLNHGEEVGGNNHFDIFVFRNALMFGDNEKSFVKYTAKDFKSVDTSRLTNESAKDEAILEFIQCVLGLIPKSKLKSSIESHAVPVSIMSAIYQSQTQQVNAQTPLAHFDIGYAE